MKKRIGLIAVCMMLIVTFASVPVMSDDQAADVQIYDDQGYDEKIEDDQAADVQIYDDQGYDEQIEDDQAADVQIYDDQGYDEQIEDDQAAYVQINEDQIHAKAILEELSESFSSTAKNGLYLPDVTAQMSNASYWAQKLDDADEVLSDRDTISALNDAILNYPDYKATGMNDLKNWPYETYDGVAQNNRNISVSSMNAEWAYDYGACYDINGEKYTPYDSTDPEIYPHTAKANIYEPIIDNSADPDATTKMPVLYAVCANRTCLQILPTDNPLWDEYPDKDSAVLWESVVRVNEPLILKTKSADGLYYLAISSNSSGWIPAADVAICANKAEWLSAWDIAPEKTLVVYGDKIITEDSCNAPETANRLLTMGTCLELADEEYWESSPVIGRWAYNNHVVWLPVRNDDGSYKKVLALIGENRQVSENFLPLTQSNILKVMMNQLGDTYGWGGMLTSNDCSGYVRDVYKCFGLELARNTTEQPLQPVYKVDLSGMEDEKKTEYIRSLPAGTALYFNGHAMMYLGEENGKVYVISSVGTLLPDESSPALNVRGCMINTLDVRRGKRYGYTTWLQNLHTAVVPFYTPDHVITHPLREKNVSLETSSMTYTGKALTPAVKVTFDGKELTRDVDYTVEYENNTNAGTASVLVTGINNYRETVSEEFKISKAASTILLTNKTAAYSGKNINIGKAQTTGSTGRISYTYYTDKACTKKTKSHKNAGTYYVKAVLKADKNYNSAASNVAVLEIKKTANTITAEAKTTPLSANASKTTTIKASNAFVVKEAKGTVTYKKTSGNSKITVSSKGTVTVKKGLEKGNTYIVKVQVKAAGNSNYKAGTTTVTLKIKIK